MKTIYACAVAAACVLTAVPKLNARQASVTSPDGHITLTVDDTDGLSVSLRRDSTVLIAPSRIGMSLRGASGDVSIKSVGKTRRYSEEIAAPRHHTPSYTFTCNESVVKLNDGSQLTLRAMDDGAAYRFTAGDDGVPVIVEDERLSIVLPDGDVRVWLTHSGSNGPDYMATDFQSVYTVTPVSGADPKPAFLPATFDYGGGLKVTLLESDVRAYPGMYLCADSASCTLNAHWSLYPRDYDYRKHRRQRYTSSTEDYIARTEGRRDYPWRVFAVTADDRMMPVNSLVYSLAEPSRYADTGWVREGKVAWDWWNDWGLAGVPFKAGINMPTYKYYIDFAAGHGIEYVILDEGWYDSGRGEIMKPVKDLDLPGLIEYADSCGVKIILWTVFNHLDDSLEEACRTYSEMGAKGFKIDFLDRNDQTAAEMTYRIADACARHGMVLDLHGFYTPTGLERTFPNILNYESVFGMEEVKWIDPKVDMPRYDVTFPYIRMMAGPVDYTPGAMTNGTKREWRAHYYNPMSQGTRCHQLATYIVHHSPLTMLADAPTNYEKEMVSLDFITSLPTVFDETQVIDGRMGEYIVTMRRKGDTYYVGGMTDWTPRDVTVDFSFLPEDVEYDATIFTDGVNADKQGEDHVVTRRSVDRLTRLPVRMASGGGLAMRLERR